MTPLLADAAALLAGVALLAGTTSRRERIAHRLRRVVPAPSRAPGPVARTRGQPTRRAVAAATGLGVALSVAFTLGGLGGAATGATAGVVVDRVVSRLPNDAARARRAHLLVDLPLGLDLVAACLVAGAPLVRALEVTSQAVGGPLGDELAVVARALRLGGSPQQACARLRSPDAPSALAAVARAFGRADESGSRLATQLLALADRERDAAHGRALDAARRVGVAAVAPLGACFLPAFVVLGVVPVVVGAARHVLP